MFRSPYRPFERLIKRDLVAGDPDPYITILILITLIIYTIFNS